MAEQQKNVPDETDLTLSSADYGLGDETPQQHQGQDRSVKRIESQAGRKAGRAKRTAGAKRQATRAAKGGALKKSKGRTGAQKAGKQKTSKKRPLAGKSAAQRRRRKAA
jgi:hypothetical protein